MCTRNGTAPRDELISHLAELVVSGAELRNKKTKVTGLVGLSSGVGLGVFSRASFAI